MASAMDLNERILENRLRTFQPEPLISLPPNFDISAPLEIPMVVEDENNVDLAKINYLNLINTKDIENTAEQTIREYGVGTCGPRAFYGTTDVHLDVEQRLADFLHFEESILYSYGFVAISSSIAAYCKKNDVVFIDENANFAIKQGLVAAKSKVIQFNHCNAESLRDKIEELFAKDGLKLKKRFLIIEGISWETGRMCNLPEFVQIAEEYKLRIFLDESYTLGVVGKTGRGLLEHFNIEASRVDMSFGTLEAALGSIGGYCAGSHLLIEHQRLNGSGYIFSASLPTYLCKIIMKGMEILSNKPMKFQEFTTSVHQYLVQCGYDVLSDPLAPFKVLTFNDIYEAEKVYNYFKDNGVHVIMKETHLVLNLNLKYMEDEKSKWESVKAVLAKAKQIL